jgi:hypothetical protein
MKRIATSIVIVIIVVLAAAGSAFGEKPGGVEPAPQGAVTGDPPPPDTPPESGDAGEDVKPQQAPGMQQMVRDEVARQMAAAGQARARGDNAGYRRHVATANTLSGRLAAIEKRVGGQEAGTARVDRYHRSNPLTGTLEGQLEAFRCLDAYGMLTTREADGRYVRLDGTNANETAGLSPAEPAPAEPAERRGQMTPGQFLTWAGAILLPLLFVATVAWAAWRFSPARLRTVADPPTPTEIGAIRANSGQPDAPAATGESEVEIRSGSGPSGSWTYQTTRSTADWRIRERELRSRQPDAPAQPQVLVVQVPMPAPEPTKAVVADADATPGVVFVNINAQENGEADRTERNARRFTPRGDKPSEMGKEDKSASGSSK